MPVRDTEALVGFRASAVAEVSDLFRPLQVEGFRLLSEVTDPYSRKSLVPRHGRALNLRPGTTWGRTSGRPGQKLKRKDPKSDNLSFSLLVSDLAEAWCHPRGRKLAPAVDQAGKQAPLGAEPSSQSSRKVSEGAFEPCLRSFRVGFQEPWPPALRGEARRQREQLRWTLA